MKAELKPRIDFAGRTRLETVIPLSTPYLVFLDPSDVCNAKCLWCPTSNKELLKSFGRFPQLMDYSIYCKIVDDLCDMPEVIKTLRLYSDGEPLLNPHFPNMVQYAKQTGRFGQIDTTTNSSIMNADIISCGLDKIFFSIPERYDKETVVRVRQFYEGASAKVYVKIIGDHLLDFEKELFMQDFGDISDRIFIENRINCWPSFDAGPDPAVGIYGNPLTNVKTCPYIFYSLKINSNGTVSLCFLDYRHDMILGDLKEQSFSEIWNGPMLRQIQVLNLRKYRSKISTNCANCKQLIFGAPDNVDPFADEILKKIS